MDEFPFHEFFELEIHNVEVCSQFFKLFKWWSMLDSGPKISVGLKI